MRKLSSHPAIVVNMLWRKKNIVLNHFCVVHLLSVHPPDMTECASTVNQASPAIYVFLVLPLPNFLPCAALFVCNIYPKLLFTVSHPNQSLGPCFSSFLKHAHTSTCCALLIYWLTLYIFPFTFSQHSHSHFYSLSYLRCVPHMRYDHTSHIIYFSTTSAEHNLYTAVCMNILTEAVKAPKLQELHYLTSFTLIIINNLYPLLAQPTVIQKH